MNETPDEAAERRRKTIRAIAGLIAHLHVPRSMGSVIVPEEYDEVRKLIDDFGWSDVEEIEARLLRVL